jgi:DNA invertase Pin-like site-specific DNA recombinase
MRTAYSYLRFSTPKQEHGDSTRRQTDAAQRASREHGWQLSNLDLSDKGIRAFRGLDKKKGKLGVFLVLLEKGLLAEKPVLILEDFDRLSREQIDEARELVRRILLAGCDIFCTLTWRLYTKASLNEPMALLEMVWRFYLSHEESAKKAKRSRENWATKHKEAGNKLMSSIRPWWLGVEREGDDRRFVPLPERVAIVRKIFAWCIQGWGFRKITVSLNKAKVKSAEENKPLTAVRRAIYSNQLSTQQI